MTGAEPPSDGPTAGGESPDDRPPLTPSLWAGAAIYNEGAYHEAHDAWEEYWLSLPDGDDERLLHGLIQFTAAVHHAHERNWEGATGLAGSGRGYLEGLPTDYRGVNVADIRAFLGRLTDDPELLERERPLRMTVDGRAVSYEDLSFPAAAVVAEVFAEEEPHYEEAVVERAVEYAEDDLADGEASGPFVALVMDFGLSPDRREIAYRRLAERVERRDARRADVEGLFEE